ncbi:hypothetical protein LTR74_006550, partial [Friedmanniomyces endolithicus]
IRGPLTKPGAPMTVRVGTRSLLREALRAKRLPSDSVRSGRVPRCIGRLCGMGLGVCMLLWVRGRRWRLESWRWKGRKRRKRRKLGVGRGLGRLGMGLGGRVI